MTNSERIREIYHALQERLAAGLSSVKTVLDHPGAKGSATEINWLKTLADHLPNRYQVNTAFVIDSEGGASEQIDIVIYDRQYTPVLFNHDGQLIVPAESVYAVFEVKQEFNKDNLEYASNKAASVRQLRRTATDVVHAGGAFAAGQPKPILAGILASKSGWTPPFGEPFREVLRSFGEQGRLDLGCALLSGAFEITATDGLPIQVCSDDEALAFFFLTLLRRLQQLGTVTAIDYERYQACLRSLGPAV